jgi:hypothetical protein
LILHVVVVVQLGHYLAYQFQLFELISRRHLGRVQDFERALCSFAATKLF